MPHKPFEISKYIEPLSISSTIWLRSLTIGLCWNNWFYEKSLYSELVWSNTKICNLISRDFLSLRPSDAKWVGNLAIIGSDNGLSPARRQAIIWTNARILLIAPLGTNFSNISIEFHTFPFKKILLNMSAKWLPFCLGLNVLKAYVLIHLGRQRYTYFT